MENALHDFYSLVVLTRSLRQNNLLPNAIHVS